MCDLRRGGLSARADPVRAELLPSSEKSPGDPAACVGESDTATNRTGFFASNDCSHCAAGVSLPSVVANHSRGADNKQPSRIAIFLLRDAAETLSVNKEVCATGTIAQYAGKAEVIVRRPTQIVVRDAA
jgi:hypothetical protein